MWHNPIKFTFHSSIYFNYHNCYSIHFYHQNTRCVIFSFSSFLISSSPRLLLIKNLRKLIYFRILYRRFSSNTPPRKSKGLRYAANWLSDCTVHAGVRLRYVQSIRVADGRVRTARVCVCVCVCVCVYQMTYINWWCTAIFLN